MNCGSYQICKHYPKNVIYEKRTDIGAEVQKMRFYLQTARWCCRHCGNIQTTTNEPNTLIKHPGFCSCKFRDWELDLKNSDLVEEDEKIESPLFQQGKLNIFVDYVKLAEMFQEKAPFFYDKSRIWWIWEEETKSWKINDETDIINSMNSTVNGLFLFKQQTKTEIINALKMQGRKKTPETIPKTWVQFLDKITDVKTGKMFEANSKYFITNPLPWKIGETEETPVIDKLFHDWVEEKYIPTLYEILAFSILPDYPLHRVFCLNGSGRNGKGSFLNILTKFIGNENICSTDFDLLTSGRFESAKLYKKLVCLMGEINSSIFKRTALFKKLTGGDMIGFELKGRDSFDDFNYAKLIIATNKLPEPADKTIGFFSRWLIIDFNNIFEEKSGLIETIPEKEFENLAKKSIRILSELLEKNKFSNDGNYEDREQRYEERSSPLR